MSIDLINLMDDVSFGNYALDVAKGCAKYAHCEYSNGTLFVDCCSPREASAIQTTFECSGIGVIVTAGAEYSFDFI